MIERPPVSAAKRLGIAQPALLSPSMHQLAPPDLVSAYATPLARADDAKTHSDYAKEALIGGLRRHAQNGWTGRCNELSSRRQVARAAKASKRSVL
jgi:hypothetical protein